MTNSLPPGIRFLAFVLPKLCGPYFLIYWSARFWYPSFPSWTAILIATVVYLVIFSLRVQYSLVNRLWAADRVGATLPVALPYKVVGGLDLIAEIKDEFETRYPGVLLDFHAYISCAYCL